MNALLIKILLIFDFLHFLIGIKIQIKLMPCKRKYYNIYTPKGWRKGELETIGHKMQSQLLELELRLCLKIFFRITNNKLCSNYLQGLPLYPILDMF